MCVKMVVDNISHSYDPEKNFLEQAENCSEVIVDYSPEDDSICHFLQNVQECAKNGTKLDFNIKVDYRNYLSGFKTIKGIRKALNDIKLNEVIKLITLSQYVTEKKLEEISNICTNRE